MGASADGCHHFFNDLNRALTVDFNTADLDIQTVLHDLVALVDRVIDRLVQNRLHRNLPGCPALAVAAENDDLIASVVKLGQGARRRCLGVVFGGISGRDRRVTRIGLRRGWFSGDGAGAERCCQHGESEQQGNARGAESEVFHRLLLLRHGRQTG